MDCFFCGTSAVEATITEFPRQRFSLLVLTSHQQKHKMNFMLPKCLQYMNLIDELTIACSPPIRWCRLFSVCRRPGRYSNATIPRCAASRSSILSSQIQQCKMDRVSVDLFKCFLYPAELCLLQDECDVRASGWYGMLFAASLNVAGLVLHQAQSLASVKQILHRYAELCAIDKSAPDFVARMLSKFPPSLRADVAAAARDVPQMILTYPLTSVQIQVMMTTTSPLLVTLLGIEPNYPSISTALSADASKQTASIWPELLSTAFRGVTMYVLYNIIHHLCCRGLEIVLDHASRNCSTPSSGHPAHCRSVAVKTAVTLVLLPLKRRFVRRAAHSRPESSSRGGSTRQSVRRSQALVLSGAASVAVYACRQYLTVQ